MAKRSETVDEKDRPEEITRRDFLYGAAATTGIVALQGCTNGPGTDDAGNDAGTEDAGEPDPGYVIDMHRHCLWQPETPEQESIETIIRENLNWQDHPSGNSTVTLDGISSIINAEYSDIDTQVQKQDEAGVTLGILSVSMNLEAVCRVMSDLLSCDDLTRVFNDRLAALVAKYPSKLAFMATVNPFSANSASECERCINDLGAIGISICTSWEGEFLGSTEIDVLWKYAEDNNLAIFLHPTMIPVNHEKIDMYRLEEVVARPCETALSVAHMIYSGVFDRFSGLKVVLPHMGGALPSVIGRLDFGYRLGYEGLPTNQIAVCKRKPSEYLRTNLYVDIMGFSPSGITQCIELFGADRVLFGTDYAAVDISPAEHIEIVKNLGLSRDDEAKIFWKNASNLFKVI